MYQVDEFSCMRRSACVFQLFLFEFHGNKLYVRGKSVSNLFLKCRTLVNFNNLTYQTKLGQMCLSCFQEEISFERQKWVWHLKQKLKSVEKDIRKCSLHFYSAIWLASIAWANGRT